MNENEMLADPLAPTLGMRVWYNFCYASAAIVSTLGFSFRFEGRENVPMTGPLIVVANHQSFLDPPMVCLGFRRNLVFLARKTLFRNPLLAWGIRGLNAVPIDQEGVAKEGIRTIAEQLTLGKAVLIFPEGSRTPDGVMHRLKPGVHLLIRKTRAPILPVGVAGQYDAWPVHKKFPSFAPLFVPAKKGTCAISVGKPFDSNYLADMPREEALANLFGRIQEMQLKAEKLRRK